MDRRGREEEEAGMDGGWGRGKWDTVGKRLRMVERCGDSRSPLALFNWTLRYFSTIYFLTVEPRTITLMMPRAVLPSNSLGPPMTIPSDGVFYRSFNLQRCPPNADLRKYFFFGYRGYCVVDHDHETYSSFRTSLFYVG